MLGQRQEFVPDDEIGVVVDPVRNGGRAEENAGVGGQGRRAVGEGPHENDSPRGQAVHIRRPDVPAGIKTDSIRPQGVDRDQNQVEP